MASEDHSSSREPSPAGGVKLSREADLQALLSRVEAGDDSPDALIWLVTTALIPANGRLPQEDADAAARRRVAKMLDADASLDAALTLVERAGGGKLMVENLGEMRSAGEMTGHWLAQLGPRGPRPRMQGAITAENLRRALDGFDLASAPTPPLALLAALLKALIAEAASPESGSTGVWTNQSPTPLSKTEAGPRQRADGPPVPSGPPTHKMMG